MKHAVYLSTMGLTALHHAAKADQVEVACHLLELGADPNAAKELVLTTPLHMATSAEMARCSTTTIS